MNHVRPFKRFHGWFAALVLTVIAVGAGMLIRRVSTDPSGGASAPVSASLPPQWTTSAVKGSPEPPSPFITVPAYPDTNFERPLHLATAPGGDRWFVCQEMGPVMSFPFAGDAAPAPFLDIREIDADTKSPIQQRRVWSLVFHPKFAENGYVYACYMQYLPEPKLNRIVRYTVPASGRVKGAVPACDPQSEKLIIEWPALIDHFGGCLVFGVDGMLYFSAGDGSGYADGKETGQDISDLNASILRIDVDHPDAGKGYSIPSDNPFVKTAGARPEVWAYGLRNVWKFSIDAVTGQLWAADVGQDLWEPIVLVERGGNYGWSVTEGTNAFRENRKRGPTPILKPAYEHEHSEARSITGGYVYRGKKFPQLVGQYIYGDFETGKVWALKWNDGKLDSVRELVDTPLKLVAFGQDADGELALLDYQGSIHRLALNPALADPEAARRFPRKLSQTGLFASTKDHTMATGVVPYEVNSPLWSDGAYKHRYLAVPAGAKISYKTADAWGFPEGSVLVKTFELELKKGDPASRRRLETRLLHIEDKHWRGYTYIWNDDQTDAELLEDPKGRDQAFMVRDAAAPGGERKQVWHFPGRAECTLCHTMPAGFVLGPTTPQMNRLLTQPNGAKLNQIAELERRGLFDKPVLAAHNVPQGATAYDQLPRMPNPADTSASVEDRARAYLHANCSHCHRKWGGGNALFELTWGLPIDKTLTIDVPPQHGDHDLAAPSLIVPGHPERSMIPYRMKQLSPARMPRIASSELDEAGIALIEQWIKQMPAR